MDARLEVDFLPFSPEEFQTELTPFLSMIGFPFTKRYPQSSVAIKSQTFGVACVVQ